MNRGPGQLLLALILLSGCKSGLKGDAAVAAQTVVRRDTLTDDHRAESTAQPGRAGSRDRDLATGEFAGQSAKMERGAYFIKQPIILAGYIAGDVAGGVYAPLDGAAENVREAFAGDPTNETPLVVDFVRRPEQIRLYGRNSTALRIPAKTRVVTNCGGQPMLEFAWQDDNSPNSPDLLGLDATWNVVPRIPLELKGKTSWTEAVRDLLRREGKFKASVQIQSVQQIDLLNDGKPDVVVYAAQTKWRGRCARDPKANGCRSGGEFDAERSYGVVAVAMDGVQPLKALLFYFSDELLWELNDWLFADVNGDNALEFVFLISYYEGWRAGVIRLDSEHCTEVMSMECML